MRNDFIRYKHEDKCDYCKGYAEKKYCSSNCTHRAQILRAGVINDKYMPKNTDEIDQEYCQAYVNWLSSDIKDRT